MQLTGIHHLTAISAKPRDNLAFYTGVLGMRLVKKTVNQDDVSAYHLFYADGKANPGTDLTFFDFPAAPERRGTNSISRTGLRVGGEKSLGYWKERLGKAGAHTGEVAEVDGRLTLPFEDGEGQRLVLVDDGGAGPASPWEKSTVPAEHQIRGLGPIVLSVHDFSAPGKSVDRRDEYAARPRLRRARCARAGPCVCDGRGRSGRRTARCRAERFSGGAAGRRRRAPRRLPHAG